MANILDKIAHFASIVFILLFCSLVSCLFVGSMLALFLPTPIAMALGAAAGLAFAAHADNLDRKL